MERIDNKMKELVKEKQDLDEVRASLLEQLNEINTRMIELHGALKALDEIRVAEQKPKD